ncbi:MAG: PilT protein domain protein [Candidatus Woesebacteria bacterium GW2011_GWA1_37_7]|uniref:PilT protein domain protein n=2 Tax=Candidatus Woeseibacteriota TaxID=1752722 RepID=A0A0G0JJP4_9BACT|nr:MAG: PilT protein domain protein [Candidatus Woesebacteria bacterium GW2011_GWA1_37_7]OGM18754.1 MAG: hypothetical protein A2685_00380 [Candidatus Woesebacteria bacterium RIFCSPHIGHO2_01_FULL_37_10]
MAVSIETSEKFVVDASFVLSYLLPDEENEYVKGLFLDYQKRKIDFISASLLPYEVVNGVKSAVIRERMGTAQAKSLIREFLKLDFALEKINEIEIFSLAISHDISIYDASYLCLAKSEKISLLTLDEKLRKLSK